MESGWNQVPDSKTPRKIQTGKSYEKLSYRADPKWYRFLHGVVISTGVPWAVVELGC